MTDQMIGRDMELAAVEEFLVGARTVPGVLLLEGEAGVGKTTIWKAAVAAATNDGFRVLSCRPAAAETSLSFSALDDLLGGVLTEVVTLLPEPQRRALDTVFLRQSSNRPGADARTVSRAALETVRLLAASGPIALAVDDAQWLDRPSALVLEYVVRRLTEEPVAVVLAWRTESVGAAPLGLDRAPWPERVRRLPIGPLSVGAVHGVVRSHVGVSMPRPLLVRVHEASGGNPFFALEIARAVADESPRLAYGEPLPIPPTLAELVRSRLGRLPAATREVLLIVAALAQPTVRLLEVAVGNTRATLAVERAVRAGVLVDERDRLEFSHPLLASGVYADATPSRRAAVHRRLAEIVTDEEERARHLGCASDEPDAGVAAALDAASLLALIRGAPSTAAELYEQAERLTPPFDPDCARRRCLAAAECHAMAGNTARGRELVQRAVATAPPGAARAEALLLFGGLLDLGDEVPEALSVLGRALDEASECPELAAKAHIELSTAHLGRWDIEAAAIHVRAALAAAERTGDTATQSRALVLAGRLDVIQGRPQGIELVEQAVRLQPQVERSRVGSLPSGWVGTLLRWADDFDGARMRLEPLLSRADELGDDSSVGELLYELSELECWAGNWEQALGYAQHSVEILTLAHWRWGLAAAFAALGSVEAHLGRVEAARIDASRGLAMSRAMGGVDETVRNLCVLGFLELSVSNPGPALQHLAEVAELTRSVEDPGVVRFAGDHIEALIGVGDLDAAEIHLERLERQGRAVGRNWALAVAARCRGLLLGTQGDLDRAIVVLDDGLERHTMVPMPFEHARTLLCAGMTRRRARHYTAARRALTDARSIFDQLGAPLWAAKVASELGRIGGRAPAPQALTATERQVVELVAAGRSNPEVAAALFMSRRTVEDHLSKIYRKLGVRSRTELAHRIAAPQP